MANEEKKATNPKIRKDRFTSKVSQVSPRIVKLNSIANPKFFRQHESLMENLDLKNVGRNDPCPCGSGKKLKKCHGESAAWQGNTPAAPVAAEGDAGAEGANPAAAFDPSKMDLNWLATFSSAIQRLPKGQMARLQSLMQKAMAGKDVARELEEFQRTLPPSFQEMLKNSPQLDAQLDEAQNAGGTRGELTEEQKVKLQEIQKNNDKAGLSRLWNRFRKK